MRLAGLVLAFVGVGTTADTARETATAAVFEGLVRGDEPGLAVLVRCRPTLKVAATPGMLRTAAWPSRRGSGR